MANFVSQTKEYKSFDNFNLFLRHILKKKNFSGASPGEEWARDYFLPPGAYSGQSSATVPPSESNPQIEQQINQRTPRGPSPLLIRTPEHPSVLQPHEVDEQKDQLLRPRALRPARPSLTRANQTISGTSREPSPVTEPPSPEDADQADNGLEPGVVSPLREPSPLSAIGLNQGVFAPPPDPQLARSIEEGQQPDTITRELSFGPLPGGLGLPPDKVGYQQAVELPAEPSPITPQLLAPGIPARSSSLNARKGKSRAARDGSTSPGLFQTSLPASQDVSPLGDSNYFDDDQKYSLLPEVVHQAGVDDSSNPLSWTRLMEISKGTG